MADTFKAEITVAIIGISLSAKKKNPSTGMAARGFHQHASNIIFLCSYALRDHIRVALLLSSVFIFMWE